MSRFHGQRVISLQLPGIPIETTALLALDLVLALDLDLAQSLGLFRQLGGLIDHWILGCDTKI